MNEYQQRAILFGFLDVHRRLAELESLLDQCLLPSPFARYTNDLAPEEHAAVHVHFARIRASMLARLREAGIPLEVPRQGVRWALSCGLSSLDSAVGEIGPQRLLGYGPLDPLGVAQAGKIQQELRRLIGRV